MNILLASGLLVLTVAPAMAQGPTTLLPNPSTSAAPDPHLVTLLTKAKAAIREEREATQVWLDARKAHDKAVAAVKASDSNRRTVAEEKEREAATAYRDAARAKMEKAKLTDSATQEAVDAAKAIYNLTPSQTDFNATNAIEHPLAPWNPYLSKKRKELYDPYIEGYRLRTLEEQTKEELKAQEASKNPGVNLGIMSGWTNPYEGEMNILPAAFDPANPAALGSTILHETSHWHDFMMTGGLPNRGDVLSPAAKFQSEVTAYRREAAFHEKLGNVKARDDCNAVAARFETQIKIANNRSLSWREIKTNPNYRDWLGADWVTQGHVLNDDSSSEDDESEALRAIREGTAILDTQVRLETGLRHNDAEGGLVEGLQNRSTTIIATNEAIKCGLDPTDTSRALFSIPASRPVPIGFQYHDLESFKASLLVFWACDREDGPPPCNDSMTSIQRRWDDPDFRKALNLTTDSEPGTEQCVAQLVATLDHPRDFGTLQKASKKFWDARRRPSAPAVPQRPNSPPNAPRPPRERNDPPSTGPYVPPCLREPGGRCVHW